jgi:hypothetical protein
MCLFNARETLRQTAKLESKSLMIDSQLVQNRGIEVANVNRVFGDVVSKIVGGAVVVTRFDAAAGHPGLKATTVVIATSRWAA